MFEIAKTASGYVTTTNLSSFCGINVGENPNPTAGLIIDAKGNLFGTTQYGPEIDPGLHGSGSVFEVMKTANGYASNATTVVAFYGTGVGGFSESGLVADAHGTLFGTTSSHGYEFVSPFGAAFEVTNSGFVPPPIFAGTPGQPNCQGKSVSALGQKYGGLADAAAALGYSSVQVLQNDIAVNCAG